MKCIPKAVEVIISTSDRAELERWSRSMKVEHRLRQRAQIVLLAEAGRSTRSIAKEIGCMPRTVSVWRKRYSLHGLAGLKDAPRSGKTPIYNQDTNDRILSLLNEPPPDGYARWSAPLLSVSLGNVSDQYIWRFLRSQKIDLARRKSWCESKDPEFVSKAADVIGLYLSPPENALVLSVDEKPSIQALERTQGYLKLSNGKTLTGHSHNYRRHGTTTLFAALNIATGEIKGKHYNRRRREEFLDFMNEIVKENPGKEIHVILDNLNTHKPKKDMWLAKHKNVHFHYTPTSASWLNQIEIWFSILAGQSLKGASFTGVKQLCEHINNFIETYNQNAKPFVWTKISVSQKGLTKCLTDL